MVKGLKAKYHDEIKVFLSPRNSRKAEALRQAFPDVRVMASNQEVVDAAEWILLAVLPDVAEDTVRALRFGPHHRVISLISQPKLVDLAAWIGDCQSVCRVNPQTFIEFRNGPILLYPSHPKTYNLFTGLGQLIVTETEEAFILAQTLTCIMGPLYFLMDKIALWAQSHGLPAEQSVPFLESMLSAMADYAARNDPNHLAELWKEVTPGGLNETAMRMIDRSGGNDAWIDALEAVRKRIM